MSDFILLLPEILIGLTLIGLLIAEVAYRNQSIRLLRPIVTVGLIAALVNIPWGYQVAPRVIMNGTYIIDGISILFRFFFVFSAR